MLDMFLSALDDAKRLMTAHDIAYVVFCRAHRKATTMPPTRLLAWQPR